MAMIKNDRSTYGSIGLDELKIYIYDISQALPSVTAGYSDILGRQCDIIMMTSSNGNIFRVTGHLREEFTGDR